MKESNEKLQQTLAEAKKEIEELRKQRADHCQAREKQNEYALLKKKTGCIFGERHVAVSFSR